MGGGESKIVYMEDIATQYNTEKTKISEKEKCSNTACTPDPEPVIHEQFMERNKKMTKDEQNKFIVLLIVLVICVFIIYKII